jgi:hypothetical protein
MDDAGDVLRAGLVHFIREGPAGVAGREFTGQGLCEGGRGHDEPGQTNLRKKQHGGDAVKVCGRPA